MFSDIFDGEKEKKGRDRTVVHEVNVLCVLEVL